AAMESVCGAVKKQKADFGIIFDTDEDRAGAVAAKGEEINRNRLIALISAILLEEKKGAYIVTDSVTSDGLTEFIEKKGGVHHRFKRGYKNVINESKKLNAEGKYSPLAIETSGHAALQENYFLDDGAYLVTRLIIALAKCAKEGKDLTALIADLPEPAEAAEIRLQFAAGCDFKTLGANVIEDLKKAAKEKNYLSPAPVNHEGIRMNFDKTHGDGWALVRMSLHEPIMPVNVESNQKGGNALIVNELYELLKGYSFLNLEPLKNFK
ncbi:MAG: phosphomannomutase/phosphoglucomutase, partial [Clostridiales bacterium]|nr:phosphomannomutase/phosphoglucomutase [Clostridiales bacterium]